MKALELSVACVAVLGGRGYGRVTCKKPIAGPFDFQIR